MSTFFGVYAYNERNQCYLFVKYSPVKAISLHAYELVLYRRVFQGVAYNGREKTTLIVLDGTFWDRKRFYNIINLFLAAAMYKLASAFEQERFS